MEKELVEYIAKALVKNPSDVVVQSKEGDKATILHLSVAESDLGRMIGRQGRVAKAIRTLLSASGTQSGNRVALEIVD